MLRYVYDGSFDGFLSVIYTCYYEEIPESIEGQSIYNVDLIHQDKIIETDTIKSQKVHKAILEKISEDTLIHVYKAFLSEIKGIEILLFKYIRLGFKMGSKVNDFLANETVREVHKYSRRVAFEAHRFLGLVRFQEFNHISEGRSAASMGRDSIIQVESNFNGSENFPQKSLTSSSDSCNFRGILYAAIEPTYNILELIANHFKERLSNEKWIIHDVKRKIGIVYENNQWIMRDLQFEKLESREKEELFYQNLWKAFHKSIGIKERTNERLQMQYMPKKYWKNLIEME